MKFRVVMLVIFVPAGVCARSGSGDPRATATAPKRTQDTQPAVRLVWGPRPNRMMRIQESIMARRDRLLDPSADPDVPRATHGEGARERRGDIVSDVADRPTRGVARSGE